MCMHIFLAHLSCNQGLIRHQYKGEGRLLKADAGSFDQATSQCVTSTPVELIQLQKLPSKRSFSSL